MFTEIIPSNISSRSGHFPVCSYFLQDYNGAEYGQSFKEKNPAIYQVPGENSAIFLIFFFPFRTECSGQVSDKPQLTFKSVAILKTALENCQVHVFQIQMGILIFSVI